MKYYFLHPTTFQVYNIRNGRSNWEDHMDKARFIVVKEVGPAMEHCEEAMESEPSERQKLANKLVRMASPTEYNESACEFFKRCAELLLEKDDENDSK